MTSAPSESDGRSSDAALGPADAEQPDLGDVEQLVENGARLDPENAEPLSSEHFEGRCVDLAASLLGTHLLYETPEGIAGGVVTETEAYLGTADPACHLSGGRTPRTEPFFSGPGTIYVYKIYQWNNLDVVTEFGSRPECILIRSLEPTIGVELMRERRGKSTLDELTTGPGKLTQALGIEKADVNDTSIDGSALWILDDGADPPGVEKASRIGISEAVDWPLRFCAKGSDFLSKPVEEWSDESFSPDEHYERLASVAGDSPPGSARR